MSSSIWNPGVDVIDSELREILQSNAEADHGAGYIAYDEDLAYVDGTVGAALKQAQEDIANIDIEATVGYTTFLKYGGNGDGVTLNDDAFAAAFADTDHLYLPSPEVAYLISQPINLNASNIKILGESRLLTKIRINNSSLPVFIIGNNLENIELSNFRMERSVAATSTGSGIDCTGISTGHTFRELDITGQWNGMTLGETEAGQIINCHIFDNYGNGIREESGGGTNLVWDIRDSRIYQNNGNGISIEGVGAATDVILGGIDNVYSVYNTGYGLAVTGQSTKRLNSLRLSGGAFSFNGNHGVYLDSYGARHRISEVSANLQGSTGTGIGRATTASAIGNGINASPNNLEMNIVGCVASQNAYSGMNISANLVTITGNTCTDNGTNTGAIAEQRSGLRIATGRIIAQANVLTNRVAGAGTQQNGIHLTDGTNCVIEGNNVAGNMAAGIVVTGTSTTNRITGNPGYNPSAMDTVTPGTSPWTYTAGPTPEDIYIKGGTYTLLESEGQTIATAAETATQYAILPLSPNQSFTLTYTAAPTVLRKKK